VPDPRQGVFETILVLDGQPVELEAHLARLEASLEELFPGRVAPPLATFKTPTGTRALRITVAPANDGKLETTVEHRPATERFATENGGKAFSGAASLRRLTVAGGLGAHKWADRGMLDVAQAKLPSGTLPLIVDSSGTALEASRANIFVVRDGALFTPPLDGRILPGVTRARVLEIAASLGVGAQEEELGHEDLLASDEVFLSGSVRGIEPVGALDGIPLSAKSAVGSTIAAELWESWKPVQVG
jgi:para-aminobenzoate synthetase / 4-amino-4-deoxychorismate lyase